MRDAQGQLLDESCPHYSAEKDAFLWGLIEIWVMGPTGALIERRVKLCGQCAPWLAVQLGKRAPARPASREKKAIASSATRRVTRNSLVTRASRRNTKA